MFVRHVSQIVGTDRDVHGSGWKSRRLVLAADDLGYSVHETLLDPGITLRFSYEARRETVYCVEGEGSIRNLSSGEASDLRPGSLYSVGIGDPHEVATRTPMKLVCIFDPPLHGREEAN